MDNCNKKIWIGYKNFKDLAYVVRSGFGYYGIYPINPDEMKPKKGRKPLPESDLEHVAGMIHLARLISWYYPEIIPKEKLDDYLFGATIHEMGELLTGDTMDDGERNEQHKDFLETLEIRTYLRQCAPTEEYSRGLKIYEEMRDKKTDFGKTLYFIDKLEACLQAIYYEAMGAPGRISKKEYFYGSISNRDKREREYTGSDKIADTWSHLFVRKAEKLEFKFVNEFLDILETAIQDVRGVSFSWIY